jgi:hypothetical protein
VITTPFSAMSWFVQAVATGDHAANGVLVGQLLNPVVCRHQ